MTEHYFSGQPQAAHDLRQVKAVLRGKSYVFTTDAGVFSKGRIDPGTRLLAEAMEIQPGDMVLDMGCGYGPLGVVAGNLAAKGQVLMVDVNQRAVELARRNLQQNGVTNAQALVGDGFAAVEGLSFDVILMNPPIRAGKAVVYALIRQAKDHLKEGGRFYVVVQTKQGAKSMKREIEEQFGNAGDIEREGGYRVILARKEAD
ncbi:MAG: class I SAM-dependent methyltransferase [Syntrophothermus sp.]